MDLETQTHKVPYGWTTVHVVWFVRRIEDIPELDRDLYRCLTLKYTLIDILTATLMFDYCLWICNDIVSTIRKWIRIVKMIIKEVMKMKSMMCNWSKQIIKHRKNCECCPGHYLNVSHYSSMSWFKFRNLSEMVNCVTNSLNHS